MPLMYVVYQPPAYMKSIVTLNPLHVLLLSFMDIGVHMQSKDWEFSTCKIVSDNLLNSPLFGWAENSDASQNNSEFGVIFDPIVVSKPAYKPILSKIHDGF